MMIAHFSMPADDPARVAAVLAEILDGEATPFPPGGPGAYKTWSDNVEVEIVRRGALIEYGPEEGQWVQHAGAQRESEVHVAICVDRPAAEVIAIAAKAGWPARACVRGGGFFSLTEVWVEGAFMIEFLDPAQAAHYRKAVTRESWKAFLEHGAPA